MTIPASSARPSELLPLVTVILPVRDELPYLERCLDSVLATDYPLDRLEVLIVDGRSTDGTTDVGRRYAAEHANVRLLDNPRRVTPAALNAGIAAARGAVIVRVDGHATYAPGYIPRLVAALDEFAADNVGGVLQVRPQGEGLFSEAVAAALRHPFAAGSARYRTGVRHAVDVDTVPFGCFRRSLFAEVGTFDERFVRNQDFEFNLRLRRAGRRVVLVPDAVSWYYARSRPVALTRQYFVNGVSILAPLRFGVAAFAWRHLAPLALVLGLLAGAVAAVLVPAARPVVALGVALYGLACVAAAAHVAREYRRPAFLPLLVPAFILMHLSFGVGTLLAAFGVCWRPAAWRAVVGVWRRGGRLA